MRRIVLILVVAVLLGSCSGASDGATTPPPASSQAAATGNINASFDVGGHKLHLRCEGAGSPGSPTVVYLHGLGGDGSDIKSMAEQERNQESVDFYRTTDQAKALVAKVPDVPVTYLAARPVELPPNWPVERMRAFIAAKQIQFTTTVPTAGWSKCSPPMTSTWTSPSSSSRRSTGSSRRPSASSGLRSA